MPQSLKRDAAIQRRRMALIENKFYPRLRGEFRRMAVQAETDFNAGGMARVSVGLEDHQKNLQVIFEDLYRVAGESSMRYLIDKYGKRFLGKIETKDMAQALTQILAQWVSSSFSLVAGITETTRSMFRAATEQMVLDGVDERVMGARIREFAEDMSGWRSRTIARTESHAAVMESQHEIIQEMDLPPYYRVWQAGGDGRTRKAHRDADGQRRKPDELFDVGGDKLRFPGDRRGKVGNVANCRCVTTEEFL